MQDTHKWYNASSFCTILQATLRLSGEPRPTRTTLTTYLTLLTFLSYSFMAFYRMEIKGTTHTIMKKEHWKEAQLYKLFLCGSF